MSNNNKFNLLVRSIDKIFFVGCKIIEMHLRSGVTHQMISNERQPNVHPQDKAVMIPHKNVIIM